MGNPNYPNEARFCSLRYEGSVAYSYAQPVVNVQDGVKYVTNVSWSNTTSGHVGNYISALSGRYPTVRVRHPQTPYCDANFADLLEKAKQYVLDALAPRKRETTRLSSVQSAMSTLDTVLSLAKAGKCVAKAKRRKDYKALVRSLEKDERILRLRSINALTNEVAS
jgi:hypothetical protein